ncbi:MAG: GNAT family N-acetyltransferase [Clostridiales bacterium]|nr:GNAT family N-acetyltransferase [Clostridiales bacterium]
MNEEGWSPFENSLEHSWDSFVLSHPQGRLSHLIGFKKTVEAVYGLRAHYWVYRRRGFLQAVFPSFFHKSLIYGKRLLSQPFSEYGGLLFSPDLDRPEKQRIMNEFPAVLAKSREERSFDYVEVRCFPDGQGVETGSFKKENLYSYGILPLQKKMNLWSSVDRSVRKNINRARRQGLTLEEGKSAEDIASKFYPLHLKSMKRLGSLPHPLSYYLTLQKNLEKHLKLWIARFGDKTISALVGWAVGQSVHITDIASDEKYFSLRGNDFLHFELIRWAMDNNFDCFDFGPVRYPGQKQYKKKWGIELREYSCFYLPIRKRRKSLSERSFLLKFGSFLWKTLVPVSVAAKAGRYLRKELSI